MWRVGNKFPLFRFSAFPSFRMARAKKERKRASTNAIFTLPSFAGGREGRRRALALPTKSQMQRTAQRRRRRRREREKNAMERVGFFSSLDCAFLAHKHRGWTWASSVGGITAVLVDPSWRSHAFICRLRLSPSFSNADIHLGEIGSCCVYE